MGGTMSRRRIDAIAIGDDRIRRDIGDLGPLAVSVTELGLLDRSGGGGEGKWVRLMSAKGHYRYQVSQKTLEQTPPRFSDRTFQELVNLAFEGSDRHQSRSRDLGRAGSAEAISERRSGDRLQSRRLRRQRVRREERTGRASRLARLHLRDRDRSTRPRDGAPPRGTLSSATALGRAAIRSSRSASHSRPRREVFCTWPGRSRCRRSTSTPSTWCCTTPRCRAGEGQQAAGAEPDQGLPALRRRRNGQGPQGRHARARLHQNRPHTGRDRPAAGLLHRETAGW